MTYVKYDCYNYAKEEMKKRKGCESGKIPRISMMKDLILEKQDLTYLNWSRFRNSSGTAGSFLKAYSELGGVKMYYKLSNYNSIYGITGHESVNELIVDRLLTLLGIEHLHYQLVHADVVVEEKVWETYVCASQNFRKKDEDKQPLDVFYENERKEGEGPLEFCVRRGWGKYIWQMLVVDYLILNRDRHGANIEVLRDKKKESFRLAPLFDHGLSLLCRCETDEATEKFDVMADLPVQCFVGSRSTRENLNLIPADQMPQLKPVCEKDKSFLLDGLDGIISKTLSDKIWEMIWRRWCYYEDFCNSRRNG